MNDDSERNTVSLNQDESNQDIRRITKSHIAFYGLFWSKERAQLNDDRLYGIPIGGVGQGGHKKDVTDADISLNFWTQKGVYILYNSDLFPVYAGQAGVVRRYKSKNVRSDGSIGDRLKYHSKDVYKFGWQYFSWFGFLGLDESMKTRSMTTDQRQKPTWNDFKETSTLNELLASFEAVLIEGFVPRFNSRGGDLLGAKLVEQV